jgi:TetR/AcrR family transcriptional regulator
MQPDATEDEVAPRRPGRPRQTDEEQARVREAIVRATEQVYAQHSYRDVTVTRIIEVAGVTRPNFYRYYRNAAEPLLIVLDRVITGLLNDVVAAVARMPADTEGPARVAAGVDGYLAWASTYRHLLPSVMADRHDPRSPVFERRLEVLEAISRFVRAEFLAGGRAEPSRTNIDVFVTTVEYISHRLYIDTDGGPEAVAAARRLMLRIAQATLSRQVRHDLTATN